MAGLLKDLLESIEKKYGPLKGDEVVERLREEMAEAEVKGKAYRPATQYEQDRYIYEYEQKIRGWASDQIEIGPPTPLIPSPPTPPAQRLAQEIVGRVLLEIEDAEVKTHVAIALIPALLRLVEMAVEKGERERVERVKTETVRLASQYPNIFSGLTAMTEIQTAQVNAVISNLTDKSLLGGTDRLGTYIEEMAKAGGKTPRMGKKRMEEW